MCTFAATNGTYSIQNGYYSIDARFEENKLVIVEPNKTSTYLKNSSGDYIFTNPTNNITYGMRVLDDKTLEAFKPGVPNSSTILTLKSSAPKVQSASNDGKSNQMKALADKYFKLAETDSDNVHTWANCASVALAYSSLSMDKAKETIKKKDKQRQSYYNYYSSKKWGRADSYDLCINSSVLGVEGTVKLIIQYIEDFESKNK